MKRIKNILICGIGAIGGYYASVFERNESCDLRILVDKKRLEHYKNEPRIINGKSYNFNYIFPSDTTFKADLIIIATKSSGIKDAINNIKNFVSDNSIIMSFLNGITSEQLLSEVYGKEKVLHSFLLGHTFFREGNNISHDGKANIIYGSINNDKKKEKLVEELFKENSISYIISDDILSEQWNKFCFNSCVNQISAITRMTFGEIKRSVNCRDLINNICDEIRIIGEKEGVKGANDFKKNTYKSLELMIDSGKTSMLQDIESRRIPETDIFGETVIKLGEKHNINTPYNRILTELIKSISDSF